MKIYTKTGDNGTTALFGGDRVFKDDLRINAYGTVDELNSIIGLAISNISNDEIISELRQIQNQLFRLGSDLATPLEKTKVSIERIDDTLVTGLENKIDFYTGKLPELRNFILPGGSKGASYLHFARTVCRRAEREIVTLKKHVIIGDTILKFINRLSDLLFVIARYENFVTGTPEIEWKP